MQEVSLWLSWRPRGEWRRNRCARPENSVGKRLVSGTVLIEIDV